MRLEYRSNESLMSTFVIRMESFTTVIFFELETSTEISLASGTVLAMMLGTRVTTIVALVELLKIL